MYSHDEIQIFAETAEVKRLLGTAETVLCDPEQHQVLAVSSAQRSEGKTLTAAAMAMSALLTHRNHKVLLVDFNWQDPSVHELFHLTLNGDVNEKTPDDLGSMVVGTP